VSDHEARGHWLRSQTLREQVQAYCEHLREVAAGRYTDDEDLDLATERAKLAREQREKLRMQNEVTRRELAPVTLLAECFANVCQQVAAQLDAVVPRLKRKHNLDHAVLLDIETEIARARNTASDAQFDPDGNNEAAADSEEPIEDLEAA
jgi:phage terminase Nu1 subunit (DNA packaging protein)